MVNIDSLWGDDFSIKNTKEADLELLEKTKKPLKVVSSEKSLKSKKTSIEDKLAIIREEVLRILGGYAENTIVIKTKQQLIDYIDKSIQNGIISVDTETDNSLDPITCKLMGPCIYTPGQKNAYIPINHINYVTGERLDWQLTEEDVAEQFKRLENTPIIFHNGKFDYEVIKCTTGVPLKIYWDTMIGARMLNENEKAGLKEQYIAKIDPSIEKYDIEHLFSGIEYAIVDPEIFALYAATDAFMTYKLYEWQLKQFNLPDNKRIFDVFKNVEIPVITVAAQMELDGVEIDKEYATRLSEKYHKKSEELDKLIETELKKYDSVIAQWRLTPDANYHPPKKAGSGEGKSKAEQLDDPVSISSPTQLAILIYDVLQYKPVDKKMPRGTGEDILVKLNEKYQIPLCDLILQKRGLEKLIGTYIDKLPECVSPKDGRLHAQFNQLGTDCITEDSAVVTSQGVLKITDIVGECADGDYIPFKYDLINENNEIEQTSHKIKFENVPTIKIKLANGFELEGTPNHPIRVLTNSWQPIWKTLDKITTEDSIIIDCQPYLFYYNKLHDINVGNNFIFENKFEAIKCSQWLLKLGILCGIIVCDKLYKVAVPEPYKKMVDKLFTTNIDIFNFAYDVVTSDLFCIKVSSMSQGINTVYDFTLPETHSFIANGFICHNTGRFSSSNPNLQNIPSHEKAIRMMFKAATKYADVEINEENNYYTVPETDDVLTENGWKKVKELSVGDIICGDGTRDTIKDIKFANRKYYLLV